MAGQTGVVTERASRSGKLRPDWTTVPQDERGEYVMALNRFTAGCVMLVSAWLMPHALPFDRWGGPVIAWMACGFLLLAHLRFRPLNSGPRRSVAIVLDVFGATIMLIAGGEATAFVYMVYLIIIIGNGVRFGGKYILAATFASLAGFALVIAFNAFWHAHLALSFGLMAGMTILPAYAFALIRQLAQARLQAEKADKAKSLFLASVSHELRTPLTSIIGMAELLQSTRLTADQAQMLGTIQTAADGQLSLVQDVLQYSRIQAGHARVEETSFDVTELLRVVRSLVAVEARKKNLLISTHVTSRTPVRVRGDERHLREVLLNLCGNAIKFTETGSVTIAADGVLTAEGVVQLRLEVMDTGIGIAPEARDHIFGLFAQANETILNRFGGTGLGLALCERQVRLMGGTIGVNSAPNAGSTFWVSLNLAPGEDVEPSAHPVELVAASGDAAWARIMQERLSFVMRSEAGGFRIAFVQGGHWTDRLPEADAFIEVTQARRAGLPTRSIRERFATTISQQASADDIRAALRIAVALSVNLASKAEDTPAEAPHAPSGMVAGPLTGLRILVADDNRTNQSIVGRMLANEGAKPVFAANGEEALEVMTSGTVDLALLDVNMPVMDGIEAAQFYNFSVLGGPRIPIVALTAAAGPEVSARCLAAGMNDCLVKPMRIAQLVAAIGKLVDRPVAEPELTLPTPAPAGQMPDAQVLDAQTLRDLKGLGGTAFLEQLIGEFNQDGRIVLAELELDYGHQDIHHFRTASHSLASIAANIGAVSLRDFCLRLENLGETELQQDGGRLLTSLRRVWDETDAAFRKHLSIEVDLPRSENVRSS